MAELADMLAQRYGSRAYDEAQRQQQRQSFKQALDAYMARLDANAAQWQADPYNFAMGWAGGMIKPVSRWRPLNSPKAPGKMSMVVENPTRSDLRRMMKQQIADGRPPDVRLMRDKDGRILAADGYDVLHIDMLDDMVASGSKGDLGVAQVQRPNWADDSFAWGMYHSKQAGK